MTLLLLLLLARGSDAAQAPRFEGGRILGVSLFWDNGSLQLDTLNWSNVLAAYSIADNHEKTPAQSSAALLQAGKKVVRIKKPSAMALALIIDGGYPVYCLSQLHAVSSDNINVSVPGMGRQYQQHAMVSDFLWEKIDRVDAEKPSGTSNEFTIRFFFQDHEQSQFAGLSPIVLKQSPVLSANQGLIMKYSGGSGAQALKVNRIIMDIYTIIDKDKNPSSIITDLEKAMDKLKLDISYTTPEVSVVGSKK